MRRSLLVALAAVLVLVAALGAVWLVHWRPRGLRHERFPAIVVITVDTLNVYSTDLYGTKRRSLTPNLGRLAAEGVWFRDAYTTVPVTLPAHTALFTGRLPEEVGVMANGDLVPPEVETLAEILRGAGYATGAFPSLGVLQVWFGLGQGFDVYDEWGPRDPYQRWFRRAPNVVASASAWIEETAPRPFFAWIHLSDPHEPYHGAGPELDVELLLDGERVDLFDLASKKSYELAFDLSPGAHRLSWRSLREPREDDRGRTVMMLDRLEVEGPGVRADLPSAETLEEGVALRPEVDVDLHNDDAVATEAALRFRGKLRKPPPSEVQEKYPQEVARADRAIGEIRALLAELGLDERTLLVVVSDHGEGLYGHGVLGHADAVFDDQLRMLWLMAGPGIEPGAVVDGGPVLHTDVLPTVLDLLDLEAPDAVEGHSLRACWEAGPCRVRRTWRSYGIRHPQMRVIGAARYLWPYKAISHVRRGTFLLDLSRDPYEFERLTDEAPLADAARRLRSTADADREELQTLVHERAGDHELDDRSLETLRALGYL